MGDESVVANVERFHVQLRTFMRKFEIFVLRITELLFAFVAKYGVFGNSFYRSVPPPLRSRSDVLPPTARSMNLT